MVEPAREDRDRISVDAAHDLFTDARQKHSSFLQQYGMPMATPQKNLNNSIMGSYSTFDGRPVAFVSCMPYDPSAINGFEKILQGLERFPGDPKKVFFIIEPGLLAEDRELDPGMPWKLPQEVVERLGSPYKILDTGLRNFSLLEKAADSLTSKGIERDEVIGTVLYKLSTDLSVGSLKDIPESVEAFYNAWNPEGEERISHLELYRAADNALTFEPSYIQFLDSYVFSILQRLGTDAEGLWDFDVVQEVIKIADEEKKLDRNEILGFILLMNAHSNERGFQSDECKAALGVYNHWEEQVDFATLHRSIKLMKEYRVASFKNNEGGDWIKRVGSIAEGILETFNEATAQSIRDTVSNHPEIEAFVGISSSHLCRGMERGFSETPSS